MRARATTAAPSRSARRAPPIDLKNLPWAKIALGAAVLGGLAFLLSRVVTVEAVEEYASRLNGVVAFGLLLILPLVGFPASLLHIAAGVRFGLVWGLVLVAASIGLQLVASWALVRVWRDRFERSRWIKRVRERIPQGAHASVTVFTVLLPGAPFAAVNYTLPLLGVPLRTLLLCAWPLHVLRSTVTVTLGSQASHLTGTRLAVLLAYAVLILGASWWTYRRLQSQFSNPPPAANGRKPRG
jgi:uncharacterized membrane protein YdjX (TVP38/TMEM64 family)